MMIRIYLMGFITALMAISFGCNKTEGPDLDTGYNTVRVYDDTLASFLNSSINIASGADRMFMTYGTGNSNLIAIIGSGNFYITSGDVAKLMAVDNKGTLIWGNALPAEMIVNDILALDDGGCIVACMKVDAITNVSSYIYLYRYDANGVNILNDSVGLAIPGDVNYYVSVNIIRSNNGNMMLYGNYQPTSGPTSTYTGECDLNLQPLWAKQYSSFQYYSTAVTCLETNDGGYLLACDERPESGLPDGRIVLRKMNSTGDALWTKYFNGHSNALCNDLIKSVNGNYILSFYSESNNKKQTFIYEINSNGDSLNAATINRPDQLYNNGLIATDDGGVFALMNSRQGQADNFTSNFENYCSSLVFDESFNLKSNKLFQTQTNTYFNHVCETSDGKIAVAGLVQMAGKTYYKPALLISK